MIEIEELVVRFGELSAVNGLTLRIDDSARYGLLGPNGAGKTTTIRCICGLQQPSSGRIRVGGFDVAKEPEQVKRLLGVVPQSLALYPALSVLKNLRIFGGLMGLGGRALRERVEWGLALARLEGKKDTLVSKLSGGMQRRLNLACSLLHAPKLMICDEPTTGVDPQSRNHIFDTIRSLQAEGITVVYTTHYMEEVEALCDRVAIIDQGRIIANDRLDTLLTNAEATEDYALRFTEKLDIDRLKEALEGAGLSFEMVQAQKRNLEQVFLELTGRQLRETA